MPCLPQRLRRLDLDSVPTAPRFLGPTNEKFWIRLCSAGGGGPNDFLAGGPKFEVTPLGGMPATE